MTDQNSFMPAGEQSQQDQQVQQSQQAQQTQQDQQTQAAPVQAEPLQGTVAPQQQMPANPYGKPSTSGLAISGLVLGLASILTSFIPIVNNASFFLALIALVLSIVGLVGINKGKHSGRGIAIAGIVLGIVSIVMVLATQALFSAALDSMRTGPSPTAASSAAASSVPASNAGAATGSSSAASNSGAAQQETDYQNLPIGTTVTMKSGLTITVNEVEHGLTNYDGSEIVRVNVTYASNGSKNSSFNMFDWKAEDASGALRSMAYYSDSQNMLNSGTLSADGQVTGNVYFDGPVSKVHYYGNIMNSSSTAAWVAQ